MLRLYNNPQNEYILLNRLLNLCAIFFFWAVSAQTVFAVDSVKLREATDLQIDDYGNLYLYKNKDLSLTKYDSLGKQMGKLMLTLPFKIQSVQNPLNIPLFSENAQELKFYDQNLNLIQTINLQQRFGFIKMAYAEDLQVVWLLDESSKLLIQYNFRQNSVINAFPMNFDFEGILDMLVFENRLYVLKKDRFAAFDFKSRPIFGAAVQNGKRIRRENENLLVMSRDAIQQLQQNELKTIFSAANSRIVDKNSATYFAVVANKLYLYRVQKEQEQP